MLNGNTNVSLVPMGNGKKQVILYIGGQVRSRDQLQVVWRRPAPSPPVQRAFPGPAPLPTERERGLAQTDILKIRPF
ncbi:hypothetical protein PGT21_030620 [Puccinia graminis f. sp. tritici]|uniref:Uncharacterized protein n=1 Tax=Puccinia graminis f. sp. tritici TaxID=56615 RepID=A0A5B0MIP8_PUCGR|nr:hypothetical protein PGTUg99_030293 [Puccinia graminis f. sp. tritici]KAA1091298.1 hypothetical protein PGT21_030620 [Puccinia graminis f. sp. tritici]